MGTAGTKQAASYLSSGSSMSSGDTLVSQNGQFTLTIQPQPEPFPQVTLTANPTVVCWSPSMQLPGSLKPPAFQFSSSGVIAVMVEMLPGSPTPLTIANGNPKGAAGPFVMSMDNDGTVRVYQGTAPNSNYKKAIWSSPNGLLAGIVNSPAIAPFPQFTGCQQTLYGILVKEFCTAWGAGINVKDLRTDVYPYPNTYSPGSVKITIDGLSSPPSPLPAGCSANDWTTVFDQIQNETTYLSEFANLAGTGTASFQTYVADCATSMTQGFAKAQTTLSDASNPPAFATTLTSVITGIFAVAGLVPEVNAVCTVLGALVGFLSSIPGGNSLTGSLDSIAQSLGTLVDDLNKEALNLYPATPGKNNPPPISADWGKLQLYNTYQEQFNASLDKSNFNAMRDQFEISVYQTLFPGWFAVVTQQGGDGPSGPYLAYAPVKSDYSSGNSPAYAPQGLTDRLTALKVSMQDVFNQRMGWSLPAYNCTWVGYTDCKCSQA